MCRKDSLRSLSPPPARILPFQPRYQIKQESDQQKPRGKTIQRIANRVRGAINTYEFYVEQSQKEKHDSPPLPRDRIISRKPTPKALRFKPVLFHTLRFILRFSQKRKSPASKSASQTQSDTGAFRAIALSWRVPLVLARGSRVRVRPHPIAG